MAAPTTLDGVTLWTPGTSASTAAAPSVTHAWKDGDSLSFHDLLDTLNPLQHIPIISSVYRWLTGDMPGNVARLAGDGLFGGPIGFAAGLFSIAFKEETGKDPGEMAIALLSGSDKPDTAVAATTPAPAAPAPAVQASAAPAPAAAPPAAIAAASAATPSHPLLPLYRSPAASAPVAPAPASAAEQGFLAQTAALQQRLYGQRALNQPRTTTAPIPLQLTGAALALPPARQAVVPPPVAAVAASATSPALPQNAPIDIPQRMLDALDKYAQMQQQQQRRGQQVDLSP